MSQREADKHEKKRSPLFDEDNCWRSGHADRFGWLVDGENYYCALRESLEAAEREILIVGWDIDSSVNLVRDESHPHYPSPLAETLQTLVDKNESLRVYVLSWDFAMLYVLEREMLPAYRFGWQDSERLHFHLDGRHASGASHHQKIVVIDAALAYIGGFDLTKSRWDTRAHADGDPGRVNTDGRGYRPFHDVQAVVSGEPARQLRELVSFRWQNATGDALPEFADTVSAAPAWPESVPVRGEDLPFCLARTWAMPDDGQVVREVERLYLDMIGRAKKHVYVENQYFTSESVADALCARLEEEDGPEVLIVMPAETSGWLEQVTMDVLRNAVLNKLCAADKGKRLEIMAPVSAELGDTRVNVHSKVMIVDDRWTRIGSANLSRRSMGLDSECDIVVESGDDSIAAVLCADLLAEHLGAEPDEVAASVRDKGLLAALHEHNGGSRSLERLDIEPVDHEEVFEPLANIADLEKPVSKTWGDLLAPVGGSGNDAAEIADEERESPGQPGDRKQRGFLRLLDSPATGWILLACAVLGAVAWAVMAAREAHQALDPLALLAMLREHASHPLAPVVAVCAFVAGSIVIAPVTAMIALSALLFSPWIASLTAIAGTLAATAANYAIGSRLGGVAERRAPGALIERMRSLGRSSDAWSLAGLRLIPVAPFTVVNLLAGAAGVKLRDFLLGTLLGMGPGIVLVCFSVDRARAALSGEPVFEPWIIAVIALAGFALVGLRAWQNRRSD